MDTRHLLLGGLSVACLCLSGCFSPDYGDGGFTCNSPSRRCPEGYICVQQAEARVCKRPKGPPAILSITVEPTRVALRPLNPERITVTLALENFSLEPANNQPNQKNTGHFHLFLDNEGGFNDGYVAGHELKTEVVVHRDTKMFSKVTPGSHKLFVSLINNNHTELDPPVRAATSLDIQVIP